MKIHVLPSGPIETNAFLLTDSATGLALLIDAPEGVWPQVSEILARENVRLDALVLTHGHWDHTGDAAEIQKTGIPVLAHEADRALIENPELMRPFTLPGVKLEPTRIDRVLQPGETVTLAGRQAEIRHVPGHCPGNILVYFPDLQAAFVGDSIFAGSIGRTDLPGGDFSVLERSIRTQIYTLPDATTLYPGHGPETTVEQERRSNPFVPGNS